MPASSLIERDEELELGSRIQQVPVAPILAAVFTLPYSGRFKVILSPAGAIVARDIDVGPQIVALVPVHRGVGRACVEIRGLDPRDLVAPGPSGEVLSDLSPAGAAVPAHLDVS